MQSAVCVCCAGSMWSQVLEPNREAVLNHRINILRFHLTMDVTHTASRYVLGIARPGYEPYETDEQT